ncbi:hypothetical protein B0T11DRAFT_328705 [Plectosphaerella cucumerina]|uniref:Uncharacterized protein n=1 Tax=Plectosphaerella cucumerina TaxID=40658 RepID=A0A8K0X3G4_9PEZI|nr:hypothetical protein B0T11DRAFT_328705 [Plectosphaerella cucumerina]
MTYLPPELWELIAQFLLHTDPSDPFFGPYDTHSVSQLCLTSKTLNKICTPVLYKDLAPSRPADIDAGLFQALIQSSQLAQQVKFLTLEHGGCGLWQSWSKLTPAVRDVYKQYLQTLDTMKSNRSFTSCNRQIIEGILEHERDDESEELCTETSQSILLSHLPNLRELTLETTGFLPGVPQGVLSKLRKVILKEASYGQYILEFSNLRFLAEAATNIDTLSIVDHNLDFFDDGLGSSASPMFPMVTTLSISGPNFCGLQHSAAEFIRAFSRLQTFRVKVLERVDSPRKPKIISLLQAVSYDAPQLKHLCLKDGRSDPHRRQEEIRDLWLGALDELPQLTRLQSLTIDMVVLYPDASRKNDSLRLVNILPEDLHHLHIRADNDDWLWLCQVQASFCELARVIVEENRFRHLKRITFTSKIMRGRIGKALDALKEAGVPMVRTASPWDDEDGLFKGA